MSHPNVADRPMEYNLKYDVIVRCLKIMSTRNFLGMCEIDLHEL